MLQQQQQQQPQRSDLSQRRDWRESRLRPFIRLHERYEKQSSFSLLCLIASHLSPSLIHAPPTFSLSLRFELSLFLCRPCTYTPSLSLSYIPPRSCSVFSLLLFLHCSEGAHLCATTTTIYSYTALGRPKKSNEQNPVCNNIERWVWKIFGLIGRSKVLLSLLCTRESLS